MSFRSAPLLTLVLVGCADPGGSAADGKSTDSLLLQHGYEGTPGTIGLLRFVNSQAADLSTLDGFLYSNSARNIVAHRDGPDGIFGTEDDNLFDTLAELDGIPRVGPAALEALYGFAFDNGYVPAGDDYLGTWEGLDFSVNEAQATLSWANTATHTQLDVDTGLYTQAADSIVANRPFHSITELDETYWIGPSTLETLKSYANREQGERLTNEDVLAMLAEVSATITFTSESDYPYVPFSIAGGTTPDLTTAKQTFASTVQASSEFLSGHFELPYENWTVEPWRTERPFDPGPPQEWWTEYEYERAHALSKMQDLFDSELTHTRSFSVGEDRHGWGQGPVVWVFFVGERDGDLVGYWSIAIWT